MSFARHRATQEFGKLKLLHTFKAGEEPGSVKIGITVTEGEVMYEH